MSPWWSLLVSQFHPVSSLVQHQSLASCFLHFRLLQRLQSVFWLWFVSPVFVGLSPVPWFSRPLILRLFSCKFGWTLSFPWALVVDWARRCIVSTDLASGVLFLVLSCWHILWHSILTVTWSFAILGVSELLGTLYFCRILLTTSSIGLLFIYLPILRTPVFCSGFLPTYLRFHSCTQLLVSVKLLHMWCWFTYCLAFWCLLSHLSLGYVRLLFICYPFVCLGCSFLFLYSFVCWLLLS